MENKIDTKNDQARLFKLIDKHIDQPNQIRLDFFIPDNLIFFKGHFEDCPILPGIVQLDLAIYYAKSYLGIDLLEVDQVTSMKFMKVIQPKVELCLMLNLDKQSLVFKYCHLEDTAHIYSMGKILLKRKNNV
ncbi:hypothetical protein L3V79_00255 [Thiotrichales bacterium 19S9-12]|nr:hypothetical protein [Thiotrichales bacterium 19S9-11]MCF6810798.1 hypothetical protein [Thiotrichales bacterium 19S9-12]